MPDHDIATVTALSELDLRAARPPRGPPHEHHQRTLPIPGVCQSATPQRAHLRRRRCTHRSAVKWHESGQTGRIPKISRTSMRVFAAAVCRARRPARTPNNSRMKRPRRPPVDIFRLYPMAQGSGNQVRTHRMFRRPERNVTPRCEVPNKPGSTDDRRPGGSGERAVADGCPCGLEEWDFSTVPLDEARRASDRCNFLKLALRAYDELAADPMSVVTTMIRQHDAIAEKLNSFHLQVIAVEDVLLPGFVVGDTACRASCAGGRTLRVPRPARPRRCKLHHRSPHTHYRSMLQRTPAPPGVDQD